MWSPRTVWPRIATAMKNTSYSSARIFANASFPVPDHKLNCSTDSQMSSFWTSDHTWGTTCDASWPDTPDPATATTRSCLRGSLARNLPACVDATRQQCLPPQRKITPRGASRDRRGSPTWLPAAARSRTAAYTPHRCARDRGARCSRNTRRSRHRSAACADRARCRR